MAFRGRRVPEQDLDSVLITGASGFIGSVLAQKARVAGWNVLGTEGVSGSRPADGIRIVDPFELDSRELKRMGITTCIHLAESPLGGHPSSFRDQRTKLEILMGREFPKFIYFSSGKVYGTRSSRDHSEEDETNPDDSYAAYKLEAENLVSSRSDATILRISNVFGPGSRHDTVTNYIAGQLSASSGHLLLRAPGSVRDFIHVVDVAAATLAVLQAGESGVFNVSTGIGLSVEEVVSAVCKSTGRAKPNILWADSEPDRTRLVLSNKKIAEKVGWVPQISLFDKPESPELLSGPKPN